MLTWWRHVLRGVGSLADLAPAPPCWPDLDRDGLAADAEAIAGDWQRVGDDLRWAIEKVSREVS